jgi:hypothetical protein
VTSALLARCVKHVVPPRARFLLRTELNMVRSDGAGKALRWNAMLADAWLRDRLNRHHYRLLTPAEASQCRKSETVFVFGSGSSLNEISPVEWDHIAQHDVFGFNAFYHQQWIPVSFHLLRGGLYGELRWRRYAGEVAELIRSNPHYGDTVFVMQEEFLAQFTNQLIGYKLFPPVRGLLRYSTSRADGVLPSPHIAQGLRHIAGTLTDAVNCAFCLGWRHIVLTGVDLYDSRYFWLRPDETTTVDRVNATMAAASVNALGGTRSEDRHYTTRNGIVDVMAQWHQYFASRGVTLTVYNTRSLLANVMPVYSPTGLPMAARR